MIKYILLAVLFFYTYMLAFSQDKDVDRQLSFGLGYENTRLKDDNVSPLVYSVHAVDIEVRYRALKEQSIKHISLSPTIGTNQSKRFGAREAIIYDPYSVSGTRDSVMYELNPALSFAIIHFSAGYSRLVSSLKMYVGGQLEGRFMYSAMGADTWFFNQISGLASALKFFKINEGRRVEASFSTPLISHIVRQPYATDPSLDMKNGLRSYLKTGSDVVSFNRLIQLNLGVKHFWSLDRHQLALGYQFSWTKYRKPNIESLKFYSNQLYIIYVL